MRTRLVVGVLAALIALALSLPVQVGIARPATVALTDPEPIPARIAEAALTERFMPAGALRRGEPGRIRIVESAPENPVADLLFLHGHADRADNHQELFAAWRQAGLRVLAPDLPSHGETSTRPIDAWSTADIAALIGTLDRAGDARRPLMLAGWSYGGLVITRILQEPAHLAALTRRPSAAVLLAPAVAPRPFTGGDGIARSRTLTHTEDPPVAGPPDPVSPLLNPIFATRLLGEAWAARSGTPATDVPVLVVVAGADTDWYVDAPAVEHWAQGWRTAGHRVDLLVCAGARHAVDLEPWPVGPTVRARTVEFLTGAAAVQSPVPSPEEQPCQDR
jgi:alpha-beta hydrolase superfamily lysophospholipase